jgi:hypothetical protein
MIHVRLYADLRPQGEPDKKELQVESRPGLTVADVVREARVAEGAIGIVVINGQAEPGFVARRGRSGGRLPHRLRRMIRILTLEWR